MGLISELQRVYREYKFNIIPIIVGSLGYIPKELGNYIKELNLNEDLIFKIQKKSNIRFIKGCKNIYENERMKISNLADNYLPIGKIQTNATTKLSK